MQIRVLFFGILKDLAGRSADDLYIPEGSRAGDVIGRYENLIPNGRLSSVAISVNQEYSSPDTPLRFLIEPGVTIPPRRMVAP